MRGSERHFVYWHAPLPRGLSVKAGLALNFKIVRICTAVRTRTVLMCWGSIRQGETRVQARIFWTDLQSGARVA